ncbi:hypothetical protein F5I97DRAFT_1800184 [Phlebopus sp. FC_14]|nr:hypothetical protein F5I97DRAFT_1800184 [Phlebopus sp. FC_14]
MDLNSLSPDELQALMDVTPDSLAVHCGIISDQPAVSEEVRTWKLQRQVSDVLRAPHGLTASDQILSGFSAKYLRDLVAAYKARASPTGAVVSILSTISHLPYFVRYQKAPECSDLAVLQATYIANAQDDPSDQDVIAEMCQFLSTLFVLQGTSPVPEDVKKKLMSKLRTWRRRYRDSFAAESSGRCLDALAGDRELTEMSMILKSILEKPLNECGAPGCNSGVQRDLKQCGRCKSIVYCGIPHQKEHWSEHKKLCFPATF